MFKEDHLSFRQRKYMKVKNIIGRALGGIGLVVLSPVYLAIIVAIKKEDGITAPVFFSQKRVGIHEKLIRCDMSTGKKKELADHIQYFFAGAKLYAQKGSKIVSVSYDGKEVRVFKKDVVMMDKKEDKVYYRRMDQKKEQMYVCDVDGGMEKMVGNRD